MAQIAEGTLLWTPSAEAVENANLTHYIRWLADNHGLHFDGYPALWEWSVTEIGRFWETIWDYCNIVGERGTIALADDAMPGAVWFPEAQLNYAETIFARANDKRPAMIYEAENGTRQTFSWQQMRAETARMQAALRAMGVTQGDRVVAYLPNIPEAIIACMATVSLGAIWSSASPDFGAKAVLDRFSQIEPKVLFAVDGYQYNGKDFGRIDIVGQLQDNLPTLEQTILIPQIAADSTPLVNTQLWDAVGTSGGELTFERVPFDHPLWVLYSSGTTGLPKPIVHGHGGNLLEHAKATVFHNDLGENDRFFWYTSTGWMMWNYLIGALLSGASVVVYNGSPAYPSLDRLWQLVDETEATYFGLSPAFVAGCIKAGITPNAERDLSRIRAIGSTGAPLPVDSFVWLMDNVHQQVVIESLSGGTDLCTAFIGGARTQPLYAGEMQGASLGAAVRAFDPAGEPTIGDVGELVITRPMPSMPIRFWNDEGDKRYKASYFEMYPNIWRHGDWLKVTERGGCIIYGRSDSTINRKGVRMGTSEIYACVEALDEVMDSLVIDLEALGHASFMPLFVILREGVTLDDGLKQTIKKKLRAELSPRHAPDEIYQVNAIPYTLSGKKLEIPVRRILLGQPIEKAANLGAMRNPESIDYFVRLATRLSGK